MPPAKTQMPATNRTAGWASQAGAKCSGKQAGGTNVRTFFHSLMCLLNSTSECGTRQVAENTEMNQAGRVLPSGNFPSSEGEGHQTGGQSRPPHRCTSEQNPWTSRISQRESNLESGKGLRLGVSLPGSKPQRKPSLCEHGRPLCLSAPQCPDLYKWESSRSIKQGDMREGFTTMHVVNNACSDILIVDVIVTDHI